MEFVEAGNRQPEKLPDRWNWSNLCENGCPACGEELVEFEHLNLFKCACGFKISTYKKENLVEDIELGKTYGTGRGFLLGNYQDDEPF